MSPELELRTTKAGPSREQRIRDLFNEMGGAMGTARLAHACIERGIYTAEELDAIHIRAIQGECRRALKVLDAGGLPENGQTTERDEEGAPVWKMRQLWLFEDYELNVRELIAQRDETHYAALKLSEECQAKFGRGPEITPLEDRRS